MTPALTKHLRPAYAECGGVFMKKNRLIAAGGDELSLSDAALSGTRSGVSDSDEGVYSSLFFD